MEQKGYIEKNSYEVIDITKEIKIVGMNLQNSGMPITFESLGKMWDRYTDEERAKTTNAINNGTEYGICMNKIPDYLVGLEVSQYHQPIEGFMNYTVPVGKYIKAAFNAKNKADLVEHKLSAQLNETKKWAKMNKVSINGDFTVEVYPNDTIQAEYPEMFILLPIRQAKLRYSYINKYEKHKNETRFI